MFLRERLPWMFGKYTFFLFSFVFLCAPARESVWRLTCATAAKVSCPFLNDKTKNQCFFVNIFITFPSNKMQTFALHHHWRNIPCCSNPRGTLYCAAHTVFRPQIDLTQAFFLAESSCFMWKVTISTNSGEACFMHRVISLWKSLDPLVRNSPFVPPTL